jgi:putative acetyltransferase
VSVRDARAQDAAAVRAVHEAAFGQPDEARLVSELAAETEVSLVATDGDEVVGHVLLSRATLSDRVPILALAPLGVLPAHQGRGHGRALVRAAVERARATDYPLVVVVGHPAYYAKLGFEPARRLGVRCPIPDVPVEAWRALRLPAWSEDARGTVRYPPAFGVG